MIPVVDLKAQYQSIKEEIDSAIQRVLSRGWFVLGEEGESFEREFASFVGTSHAIGVNTGTDALSIALRALDTGQGDEVITTPLTATYTALAISMVGAMPVFADIDEESYNIDPKKIEEKITQKTKALIPVHLYGQPADLGPLLELAREYNLKVVEDVAQAHGALYKGQRAGSFGDVGCFSFYPSKNLGACGDAGMITTNDAILAEKARTLRNGGQTDRYNHQILGVNSRLDELQAAILGVKLKYLDKWNERRRELAALYDGSLVNLDITLPKQKGNRKHVYHLYVIRTPKRDKLKAFLEENGIGTQIHYPIPVHRQKAYEFLKLPSGSFPQAEKAAEEVLSLPMYPELTDEQVKFVVETFKRFYERES